MWSMTTSQLPTPTLQPLTDVKNLLPVADESEGSCCGGGSCGV